MLNQWWCRLYKILAEGDSETVQTVNVISVAPYASTSELICPNFITVSMSCVMEAGPEDGAYCPLMNQIVIVLSGEEDRIEPCEIEEDTGPDVIRIGVRGTSWVCIERNDIHEAEANDI
ncbi:hypothetical protein L2E82_16263 [Cichorium intybus]|uniref:Uncharacterized protein n=1 Tax=Cichorium intybus TaxID=13427 RepID=A0ACB9F693_CICIN|nr:hypothetical protein L2E82_16263 [Cichorium intybus]